MVKRVKLKKIELKLPESVEPPKKREELVKEREEKERLRSDSANHTFGGNSRFLKTDKTDAKEV